ncbi:MAG TPA: glycosyltransferase family 39 protein, partial [Chthoniobacterales bacterium]
MAAGTHTFGLHETLLEPQALPPPPTRHALFAFLVVLAAILHIGTAGWSEIHNGAEGHYAGIARQVFESGSWSLPPERDAGPGFEPPLVYWLILGSFQLFGVNAMAAHLPAAFGVVASVALTFLIGERLGSYWRGFVAGLTHLCSLGMFIWGRIVTPEPIFAALLGACIYCAICGYQRQRSRRAWFAGVWIGAALACLTSGIVGLIYPAAILALLAIFFREARLRFRALLHWSYLLLFCAVAAPWFVWLHAHTPAAALPGGWMESMLPQAITPGVSISRFMAGQAAWWFPGLYVVLPGLLFAWRKVFRPHEFEARDALPLCWMAAGLIAALLAPGREDYRTLSMWSALALWIAAAWERMPHVQRLAGIGLACVLGVLAATSGAVSASHGHLPALPIASWPGLASMLALIAVLIFAAGAAAAYLSWRDRETLAIAILLLGTVSVGLSIAEATARSHRYLSLA